jgi:signal transduction histidine kinase
MEERRRSIRVNINLDCELLYQDKTFEGQLNDISLGGARMTIDAESAKGKVTANQKGTVRFNTIWGMIEAEIMIRRIIREDPFEIGFTFERMSDLASTVFRQMVSDLLRDNLVQSHKTQAISKLVSNMANEVKGPTGLSVMAASHMNELSLSIQKMFDEQTLQPEELQKYLTTMQEHTQTILLQSKRVNELAESFKTISLDQATYERRVFVLPGYLHFIALSLRHDVNKSRHNLVIDAPDIIEVEGYPGAFTTIVTNLVQNSLQHAFPDQDGGGNIKVSIRSIEDDLFQIRIEDNGGGMSAPEQERLFAPFFTSQHDEGGTGLGLNIVGSLVRETFEGKVQIEETPGGGTTFIIDLPTCTSESRGKPAVLKEQGDWWQKIGADPT